MSDDLLHAPKVTTLARPVGRSLLDARFEVQRNEKLQAVFLKYKGRKDDEAPALLAEEIYVLLAESLEATQAALQEISRYLADEYLQIGDAVLIISRDTGLPITRITEKDIWQPESVPRYGGDMVASLPRLRPELQGFLIRWEFDRAREERLVNELAERLPNIPAISRDEDRRLLPTTGLGRQVIVRDLKDSLPTLLQDALGGSLARFLRLLNEDAEGVTSFRGFKAYARVTVQLMDHKSRNLLFDVLSSHRATIATQWAREIARTTARLAHAHVGVSTPSFPDYHQFNGLWIAAPDETMALRGRTGFDFVIPVEDAPTMVVRDLAFPIGRLHCGETQIVSREVHDRWEIAATIDFDLDLILSRLEPVQFTDLPTTAHHAQVV